MSMNVELIAPEQLAWFSIEQVWSLAVVDGLVYCSAVRDDHAQDHEAALLLLQDGQVRTAYSSPEEVYPPGDPIWRRVALRRHALGLPAFSPAPRDQGTTAMAMACSSGDRPSILYVATLSLAGSRLLACSVDGCQALSPIADDVQGVLALVATQEWLVASALPGSAAPLYVSQDGGTGWAPVTPAGFVAERNESVTSMAVWSGRLYCGTLNPTYGYQLWSVTIDEVQDPSAWSPVIVGAAERFTEYEQVAQLVVFQDALYLAASATAADELPEECGLNGAELLRIDAEHQWELLCGRPRLSSQGLKRPRFAGEGCGDTSNVAFDALCVHQQRLYIGTNNVHGCQLWCTDGDCLEPVLQNGWSPAGDDRITAMASAGDQLVLAASGGHGVTIAYCDIASS
jgi:hypothetical protein